MVDLHKVEKYSDDTWHVKLWLHIIDKGIFGNWFANFSKNSWYADDIMDCIPKGYCAYWWGLILHFIIQLPLMTGLGFIIGFVFLYSPGLCAALLLSGVDPFQIATETKDFPLNIGCAVLLLYGFGVIIGGIFYISKTYCSQTFIDDAVHGIYNKCSNLPGKNTVYTIKKLYAAHKEKYCPMIVIEKSKDVK